MGGVARRESGEQLDAETSGGARREEAMRWDGRWERDKRSKR
jgi:hypothetical protein